MTSTNHSDQAIAIVGIGCRFPGQADSPAAYWRLLSSGTDAISETPPERWNLQKFYAADETLPGKTQSKWGGYVDAIEQFDPQLFGISPREAASMDPQQRMLLEVAYRATEDAGQPAEKLAGRKVSVFVGISSFDYAVAGLSFQDRGVIDAYSNTGGSSSIAANRISYCFDLRGPSVAVDTACSSSLVALHMACESLLRGEAEMALAGGVNALLMPDFYVAFSQLGVLSPDGRCKTFDSRANGYVRSEGAGMVLLKPLHAALSAKDPIYAVIRATALNQDGRTPGMTVPSQSAQEQLLRTACTKANIRPDQIQYVEAHGTGTPVGDPIEARALGAVLGEQRPEDQPCRIGSVKTNIGHLEAGAGIASVIKVALALSHRKIPAHLHFQNANPEIDFAALNLKVPTECESWDSTTSRLAGINGFGYGGANAHVIMEQAPPPAVNPLGSSQPSSSLPSKSDVQAPILLPLSARTQSALQSTASRLADWLEHNPETPLPEVGGYLAHRRSHQEFRSTASALGAEGLISELRTIAASAPEDLGNQLASATIQKGVAFVCSGQGPQWWAMGRGMLKYSPAFRSVIKKCDKEFAKYGDWSLVTELTRSEETSRMQQTSIAQPSIFAIQVALAAVWNSWGIQPSVVVGHSVGEIAAAYLSGALSWEDACCVAFHRGRTMDLASSQGGMVAAGLSPDEVPSWLEGIEDQVSLAAINGPTSVTISGAEDAIAKLAERLEDKGVFCRRLAVEYAFHSPQMDPVKDELLSALSHIQPKATHTPLLSTVTGNRIEGTQVGAQYWWKNVRQSVRFSEAMTCLADSGVGIAVEIGPHPVLAYAINECFQTCGKSVRSVPSLNRQQDDLLCITKSLGSLYALGLDINWDGFYNQPKRKLSLPVYPFQRTSCWSESLESIATRQSEITHPLLGERADSADTAWQQRIDIKLQSYLDDHRVRENVVYPAAAMIEAGFAAATQLHERETARLERIELQNPCMLSADRPQWLRSTYDQDRRKLSTAFRSCDDEQWTPLVTLQISSNTATVDSSELRLRPDQIDAIRERCTESFDPQRLYSYCHNLGLQYGSDFQQLSGGWRCNGEAWAQVVVDGLPNKDLHLHPAVLDSCFHTMIAADPNFDHTIDGLFLPVSIDRIDLVRPPRSVAQVHTRVLSKSKKFMICDLDIYDEAGRLCLSISGFRSMRVSGGISAPEKEDLLYSYSWEEASAVGEDQRIVEPMRVAILMDEGNTGKELAQRLRDQRHEVLEVYRENSGVSRSGGSEFFQVDPASEESFSELLRKLTTGGALDSLVYLWGLDAPTSQGLTTEQLRHSTVDTTLAPLNLVRAWNALDLSPANLTMVTRGGQSPDEDAAATEVAQGPLIGFGRVIISEFAGFHSKLVDLPSGQHAADIDCLMEELLLNDGEDEIQWRGGRRFVHRFTPQRGKPLSREAVETLPARLAAGESSGIEELHYRALPSRQLDDHEVEIEVAAAGLNFADVMKALDLYPGLPDGPVILGAECSGRVVRTGPNSSWEVGQEVIAVAPGSFGTHVVVRDDLVARKPSNLTHEQAATIPIAFLTAHYALNECARLQPGESVLIHAASGGVGLAAIQFAQRAGLRILGTAGTDEKRDTVRAAGVERVMNSRTLDFADEVLEATGGVDAILNSLPGEAIAKGLSILNTGGRFLEIGKRDIYGDSPLGMYPLRNNLSFFAIDLDQLFKEQPSRMGKMLGELVTLFEEGALQPLPVRSYPASETSAAFRFMQQGKHIGKVAITYDAKPTKIQAGDYEPVRFRADATYWLAGGLGGFGLEIAQWMARQGAGSIVLSGRSATPRPAAEKAIADMQSLGCQVTVLPADITVASEVQRVLATIDRELPPLRGVIHTAMVLEDKLLVDLDRATLERVLWPKVLGGWNLHQETKELPLDHFILFSSLSSVFGHAGQANYSAANALLDSLAHFRRAQGLKATVMNWGHLGEVGYLAEREQLGQRLERQGVLSFTVEQATDCLEYALQHQTLQASVLRMDWSLWRGLGITNRVSPRFAHLLLHSADGTSDAAVSAKSLRDAPIHERQEQVDRLLRTKAGGLLGIPAGDIQSGRALLEMGLDSLMAVEMRNWIESQLEINMPISALMRSESLEDLTQQICLSMDDGIHVAGETHQDEQVNEPGTASESKDTAGIDAEELLEQLPDLGQEQVSELLSQMLRDDNP